LSNVVSGTGNLVQKGYGTLTLTGNNTYSGTTTITNGTLQVGNGGGSGALGGGNISNDSLLLFNRTGSLTVAGVISGSGTLVKDGAGTVTLAGDNTYSGPTTISAGTLQIGNGGITGSLGTGTVVNNGSLAFNRSDSAVLSNIIAGTGSFIKSGSGVVTLTAVNSYTGGTVINSGTLKLDASERLADSGAVTVNGGIFDLGRNSETVGAVTLNSGSIVSGTLTGSTYNVQSGSISASLAGSAGLTKSGGGLVTLSGVNSYTGGTIVSGGTLKLGSADLLPDIGTVIVSGGAFDLGGYSETVGLVTLSSGSIGNGTLTGSAYAVQSGTVSAVLAGSASLTKSGAGTVTLSAQNSYSGRTVIDSGLLATAGDNRIATNGNLTVNTGGTFRLGGNQTIATLSGVGSVDLATYALTAGSGDCVFSGSLSGSGSFGKAGSGTMILSGVNSYTGGTIVSGGTLKLGSGGLLSDVGALTVSGGRFDLGGYSETVGLVTLSSGSIGSGTLTGSDYSLQSGTVDAVLSGSASLTKSGVGTVTLSGQNSYSGRTVVDAGLLATAGENRIATNGNLTVNTGGAFLLGGNQTIASLAGAGSVNLGIYTMTTGSEDSIFSGNLTGLGALTKNGAGTFTLSGNNTFLGDTTISGGALILDSSNALAHDAVVTMQSGTTLTVNQRTLIGALFQTGGTVDGTGSLVSTLTVTASGALNSVIADGPDFAAGILKYTDGTTTIGAANTFTGSVKVQGGTLQLDSSGSFDAASSLVVSAGATFDLNNKQQGFSALNGNGGTVSIGAGTLVVNGTGYSEFAGGLTGTGAFVKAGAGTQTLTGPNSHGATIISAGTLQIGNGGTNGTLGSGAVTDNAALAFNRSDTFSVPVGIDGTGSVEQAGTGTVTILQSNSYSGGTIVSAGVLQLGAAERLNDSGALNVSGGAFDLGGYSETVGAVTLTGGLITNGTLSANSYDLQSGTMGAVMGGSGGFTKSGPGTVILTSENTATGPTEIRAGTLQIGNGGSTGSLGSGVITNDATLLYSRADDVVLSNVISGSGSFVKSGAGRLNLTGTNGYTGVTEVREGNLAVNGSIASGISVNAGAMLSGSGTITGDAIINGTHSPGNSPGIQSFSSNLTYSSSAGVLLQFNDNTTNNSPVVYDQIQVGKDLIFSGVTTLNLAFGESGSSVNWNNAFWNSSQTWILYMVSGNTTGFGNFQLNSSNWTDSNGALFKDVLTNGTFSLALDGQNVVMNYAVPEPSTYALFGIGGLILLVSAIRRRA
jgi:autotransporter-associated beta strand protein